MVESDHRVVSIKSEKRREGLASEPIQTGVKGMVLAGLVAIAITSVIAATSIHRRRRIG